jgi:hypothetical protein
MPTAVSATEGMAFNISDASKRMDSCKSRGKNNVGKTSTLGTPATAGTKEVAGLSETRLKSVTAGTSVRAWAQQQQGYKQMQGFHAASQQPNSNNIRYRQTVQ